MILNALVQRLKHRSKDDFRGRHFEASAWMVQEQNRLLLVCLGISQAIKA
jgi:hypothetical protein